MDSSVKEISGVSGAGFCGVFSKSAMPAPSSVSSLQRTVLFDGDFFLGVKEIPPTFLPPTTIAFLRLGDAFIGEPL